MLQVGGHEGPEFCERHPQRITKLLRKQAKELCWDGVEFPAPCSERTFRKFEENNGISLRAFGHQPRPNGGVTIIPLYTTKEIHEKIVRLFFLKSEDGTASHYCVVKNMSALVSSQVSKKKAKKYVCDFCLCPFGSQDLLDAHNEYCSKHDAVNTVMPVRGRNTLKFKNVQNAVECPIKIYADFECFLKLIDEVRGETRLHHRHVLRSFAFTWFPASRVFTWTPSRMSARARTTRSTESSSRSSKRSWKRFTRPLKRRDR